MQCNNGSLKTLRDTLEKVHVGVRCSWFHDSLDDDGVAWNPDKPRPGKPFSAPVLRNHEPEILKSALQPRLWGLRPVQSFVQYDSGPWALPDSFELPGTRGFREGDIAYSDSAGYLVINPALYNKYGFWP